MSDRTSGSESRSSSCGPVGAAVGLATVGVREMARMPLTLLKLPIVGVQQALLVGDALRRGYEDLALKGLRRVGFLRPDDEADLPTTSPTPSDTAGYDTAGYAVGGAQSGQFAHFDAEFDAVVAGAELDLDASSEETDGDVPPGAAADVTALDPDLEADLALAAADLRAELGAELADDPEADLVADLVAEVGTDIGADLAPGGEGGFAPSLEPSGVAVDDAETLVTDGVVADDEPAAAQSPTASAAKSMPESTAEATAEAVPAEPEGVDIVTRAAVAAEEAAAVAEDLPDVDRSDLPIEDFDHVTAGSLRGRLRRLELADLQVLRLYEQEHARRLPILTLLENRIAKLEAAAAT